MREIEGHGLSMGVYEITPEDAAAMIASSRSKFKNRPIKDSQIQMISEDVAAGSYTLNGESIIISDNGSGPPVVLDGQHRLKAIIRGGKPVKSVVVSGVPISAFWSIGDGIRRTLGQILAIHNHKNANVLAATLRMVYWSLRGSPPTVNAHPPRDKCIELIGQYPEIERFVHESLIVRDISSPTMAAFLLWDVSKRGKAEDVAQCQAFLRSVGTGADLSPKSPALALRNMLMMKKQGRERLTKEARMAYFISAWNAHRQGRSMGKLMLRFGDDGKIIMPQIDISKR